MTVDTEIPYITQTVLKHAVKRKFITGRGAQFNI